LHALPPQRGGARCAQFEHYARLSQVLRQNIGLGPEPWVFFSDDDDIWHPRRVEEYLEILADHPDADVLQCRAHISPGWGPRLPASATAADVSRLYHKGELRLSFCSDEPQVGLFGTATGEYFDLIVALGVLEAFTQKHNRAVVANAFADIRFRTFALKWPGGVRRFLPRYCDESTSGDGEPGRPSWMYYYDRPTEPYTTPPTEEDLRYLCTELPDLRRIAGMRQTLDCILFQLAPVVGPLRISSQQFDESLTGMLVDKGPAAVAMALDRCRIHGVEVVG